MVQTETCQSQRKRSAPINVRLGLGFMIVVLVVAAYVSFIRMSNPDKYGAESSI